MHIELERLNDAYHFRSKNEDGCTIETDGSPDIGGENKGFRPMQLLLAAVGSCSSIDIISILKKQKQPLEDLKVAIDGKRESGQVPSLFTGIHLHFKIFGDVDETKAKRAIDLSLDKYCSVAKTLEKTATITSSFEIIKN